MADMAEYQIKYRRFVQGLISEEDFRSYLVISLSKDDLINIIIAGAKSLRKAVAIGEPLEVKG
jgi:hypothetical protein